MADDVEMTPVEAAEPPKANPMVRKPVLGGAPALKPGFKPGLKLPTQNALKPGIKLPPKPGLASGLKLPPKPGTATVSLKPGLKLPTQNALKPGIKLPAKPVIRKPGATVVAAPLPKPVAPVKAAEPAVQPSAPVPLVQAPVKPAEDAAKPVPPVEPATPAAPAASESPKPMEALKSVTQKLKGITQEIPQQAVLRKTGIIADAAMTEAQKEASKHKTARISLSDAMGVAPVKEEHAPMKTIRIKRPVDIPGATKSEEPASAPAAETTPATITQRKTLKISRPGAAVRPAGKFGIKRPGQTAAAAPAQPAAAPAADGGAAPTEGAVPEIADIPEMPQATMAPIAPVAPVAAADGPAWLWTLSALVQVAACAAIGALAWFLYQNTQTAYF